ncbi:MAG: MSMEG_1061 family FMN-dependent PPOX-type flavoprotein [Pseudomonadota bacterium]
MNPEFDINSEAALREVIGAEIPGLKDKVLSHIDEFASAFIQKSPFVILATSDVDGNIDASPKGDGPGFIHIADEKTLWVPDRPGNKLAFGHQNVLNNPRVGLIFIIPGTNETLRVNGRGQLNNDPKVLELLSARGKPATLALRVDVEEMFFHCAKAFIRSDLWQPEKWPERHKVSFGEMFAKRKSQPQEVADAVDGAVEADYRENL